VTVTYGAAFLDVTVDAATTLVGSLDATAPGWTTASVTAETDVIGLTSSPSLRKKLQANTLKLRK
jgi:proteasome assembly chaperone (PAC2) family protein